MTEFNYNGCLKEKIDVRDYKINKNSSINLPISYLVPILPEVKNQKNARKHKYLCVFCEKYLSVTFL